MFSDTAASSRRRWRCCASSFVEMKTLPEEPDMSKLITEAFLPK